MTPEQARALKVGDRVMIAGAGQVVRDVRVDGCRFDTGWRSLPELEKLGTVMPNADELFRLRAENERFRAMLRMIRDQYIGFIQDGSSTQAMKRRIDAALSEGQEEK